MYQHDSAAMFKFVLRGDLSGDQVPGLEHAWTTAKSILNDRALVLDVSGLTNTDPSARELLSRMRNSGVQVVAAPPPPADRDNFWVVRVLKLAGICG